MKIKSCLLVGCGGIGSILIEPLVKLLSYHPHGTHSIIVVDGDRFESKLSNVSRQLLPMNQLWRDKVLAISRKLDIPSIIYINKYINEDNIYDTLALLDNEREGVPVIISAVDNAATRHLLLQHSGEYFEDDSYICVNPSNSYNVAHTSIHVNLNRQDITTHPFDKYNNLANPTDSIPDKGCFEELDSSPQLITANHLAAHFTLQYITSILFDKPMYEEYIGDVFKGVYKSVGEPFSLC